MLAEIYQDADRVDEAITVVERFAFRAEQEGRVDFLVSLCELYLHAERWDDALGICGRFQNFSDASSYTMVMVFFKGRALAGKGLLEPAVEVYKDALRFRSDRNQMLLASIRLGRALALRDLGRNAPARKDLNRIIADIPDFPLVQEILAEMES